MNWYHQRRTFRTRRQVEVFEDVTHLAVILRVDIDGSHLVCLHIVEIVTPCLAVNAIRGNHRTWCGLPLSMCHDYGLFLFRCTNSLDITVASVLSEHNPQGLGKVLLNLVNLFVTLTFEGIFHVRCGDRGMIPLCRESRTDDATTVEGIGYDTIEPLDESA